MRDGHHASRGPWFNRAARSGGRASRSAERYPDGAARAANLRSAAASGKWSGVMDAGRSAHNSEIFADLNQVSSRLQPHRGAELRAGARHRRGGRCGADQRPRTTTRGSTCTAQTREGLLRAQTSSARAHPVPGHLRRRDHGGRVSSFAAMNTMYAAVARRSREIGTLRVLGFSRGSILLSFLLESLLLSALGGLLGLPAGAAAERHHHRHRQLRHLRGDRLRFPRHARRSWLTAWLRAAHGRARRLVPGAQAARKEILTALREV